MQQPDWKKGDRVVRKNKPEYDSGTCLCDAYTAHDGNGVYVKVLWFGSRQTSTIRADRLKADPNEPKTYPDLASAQEAMDRGETVRIEMVPFQIDPALVQLAIDLQYKERLEEYHNSQRLAGER